MEKKLYARWESKNGKYFVNLYSDNMGFTYEGNECCGNLGGCSIIDSVTNIESKIETGYFLPDNYKTKMIRVV